MVLVASAWLAFAGAHWVGAREPVRRRAVRALGERGFTVAYAAVAALSLAALGAAAATVGTAGAQGSVLLAAASLVGAGLCAAGLAVYGRSPVIAVRRGRPVVPGPLSRVTRHPFFAGLALLAGAHAAMVTDPALRVYFGGFAALCVVGMGSQDRKLGARSADYSAHVAATPLVPRPRWPGARIAATGVAGALAVAALHPLWVAGHGALLAWISAVGGAAAVARQLTTRGTPRTPRPPGSPSAARSA